MNRSRTIRTAQKILKGKGVLKTPFRRKLDRIEAEQAEELAHTRCLQAQDDENRLTNPNCSDKL
jgi:hypothetical protein